MEETQAAPSVAVVEAPIEIPRSNTPEYAEWRNTGNLPEKKSPQAESAPAEETKPDDSVDSATKEAQEKSKRRPDVEERFKQLTDKHKQEMDSLRAKLDELSRPKDEKQVESSTPKAPQTYNEWRKDFKPTQWIEKYAKDHPTESYEDATAAMADHLGDVRDQFRAIEQQRSSQHKELNDKVGAARERYGDKFDEVLAPTVTKIMSDAGVNPNVKAMLNDSDVLPDLVFTIGSDQATLDKFMKLSKENPGQALRYIAKVELDIQSELAKGKETTEVPRDAATGKFTKPAEIPAKRGPESAPEPPIEIGSRGTGTLDDSERALKDMELGDPKAFRRYMEAENARDLRKRRGM